MQNWIWRAGFRICCTHIKNAILHARSIKCQYAYNFANSVSEFYKHTSLFEYIVKQYNA